MTGKAGLEEAGTVRRIRSRARRDARFPMHSLLHATWLDPTGTAHHFTGEALNLSATGAAFVVEESLPLDALVHLELPGSRLSGTARVRHCSPHDGAWRIGVELEGALVGWQ